MNTKILFFIVLFFPSFLFSMGIGPQAVSNQKIEYDSSYSASFGAACSLKLDTMPFYFSFSTEYNPFSSDFDINLSSDFWIFNPEILPNWNFFFGAGTSLGVNCFSDKVCFNFGPRLVSGFSWILFDGFLEIFVQQAACQNVSFEFGGTGRTFYPLELPFSLGVRFWD